MNALIKRHLNRNPDFKKVFVKGEVSDASISRGGHLYFDLKDESSIIKCVAYYRVRTRLPFKVKDGMELLIIGQIDVYPERGEYEIVVNKITEDGLGQLYVKLQQLKEGLTKEGLFKREFKKPLPVLPKKVGVVTAEGGAVIKDIIKTIRQKNAPCEIYLFPSLVQGRGSVEQLVRQIRKADEYDVDVLIVGRGGGSLQDLWSFNSEEVVRTIFECRTPVISAVGHETNHTLIDDVADIRAHTPTDAANKIVNRINDAGDKIEHYNSRLLNFVDEKKKKKRNELNLILSKSVFTQPDFIYASKRNDFEMLNLRFSAASDDIVKTQRNSLEKIKSKYVIERPCKIQLDAKKLNLNALRNRLIDAMNSIIKSHRVNLDKATDNFKFHSEKLLTTKRHSLEISKSYLKTNPCQNQIDVMKSSLDANKSKLNREISLKIENSQKDLHHVLQKPIFRNPDLIYLDKSKDFAILTDRFRHKSSEILLTKTHDLESIRNAPALKNRLKDYLTFSKINNLDLRLEKSFSLKIDQNKKDLSAVLDRKIFKNPSMIYESKREDLEHIKSSKIIKNPYALLDDYKNELNEYNEKLDKINQVIMLKKEQQKQKRIYLAVIAVIVIVVILIIIFGGIL